MQNTADRPLRVIAADPFPVILAGLQRQLAGRPEIELVDTAQDLATLLALLDRQPADLLLTEACLLTAPDRVGFVSIEAIRHAKQVNADMTVVIHTEHSDYAMLQILSNAGADAFVSKYDPPTDFVSYLLAMHQMTRSNTRLQPRLLFRAETEKQRLSKAETRVLTYLALRPGDNLEEIAENLGLAVGTIKFHLTRIYEKLGTTKRGEAVLVALRLGILSPTLIMSIPDNWSPAYEKYMAEYLQANNNP